MSATQSKSSSAAMVSYRNRVGAAVVPHQQLVEAQAAPLVSRRLAAFGFSLSHAGAFEAWLQMLLKTMPLLMIRC